MILLERYLLLLLVALTSALACVVGITHLGLDGRRLGRALAGTLDVLGLTMVFFAANAVLGVVLLLAARHLAASVVTLHALDDIALMVLSAVQAVAFHSWRASRAR